QAVGRPVVGGLHGLPRAVFPRRQGLLEAGALVLRAALIGFGALLVLLRRRLRLQRPQRLVRGAVRVRPLVPAGGAQRDLVDPRDGGRLPGQHLPDRVNLLSGDGLLERQPLLEAVLARFLEPLGLLAALVLRDHLLLDDRAGGQQRRAVEAREQV